MNHNELLTQIQGILDSTEINPEQEKELLMVLADALDTMVQQSYEAGKDYYRQQSLKSASLCKKELLNFLRKEISHRETVIDCFKDNLAKIAAGEKLDHPKEYYQVMMHIWEPDWKALQVIEDYVVSELS